MNATLWRLLQCAVVPAAITLAWPAAATGQPATPTPQGTAGLAAPQAGKPSDSYGTLYQRYLDAARLVESRSQGPSATWMAGLMGDFRARHVNDLVTVRVIESITAAGTADSSLSKSSDGSASVDKLFGLESKLPTLIDPTDLVATSSNTNFAGGGTTTRSGELTATMTARVAEVLSNGDLVLEGAREIDINGDRQIVVLTGVVRPSDVTPANTVLSTQIGQLSIRYFGRGLIRDNLKPGWLIRILNKIF